MKVNNALPTGLLTALKSDSPLSIFSIDCTRNSPRLNTDLGVIDGYRVISGRDLNVESQRTQVVEAFLKAHESFSGKTNECFFPRHALRITDGVEYILLLCFQCGYLNLYIDGVRQNKFFGITASSKIFNEFIR